MQNWLSGLYLPLIMKVIVLLLLICVAPSLPAQQFEKDFAAIADIYETEALPYIFAFAEKQLAPLSSQASEAHRILRKHEIESVVRIHKIYLEEFRKASLEALNRDFAAGYTPADRKKIINQFESGYRNTFLYLDYAYYEKCRKLVEK